MAYVHRVPEDKNRRGFDVLEGRMNARTHCIHEALAIIGTESTPDQIGQEAEAVARLIDVKFTEKVTFTGQNTRNHLYQQLKDGFWIKDGDTYKISQKAIDKIVEVCGTIGGRTTVKQSSTSSTHNTTTPLSKLILATKKQLREVEELEDHFASVKVRKYQGIFRDNAFVNFEGRCCISGMLDRKLLVASHIVPWAEDRTIRLDPGNALLLYAEYDKLFDQYYFTVEDDLRIRVVSWYKECGKPVRDTLGRIDGLIIRDGILKKINRDYLKRHRQKFALHTSPSALSEELP